MSIAKTLPWLRMAGCTLLWFAGAGAVLAQGGPGGPPPGGAPPGGFRPTLPRQGFENTGQVPADYTPAQKTAVAVAERWNYTMNHHDEQGGMALVSPKVVFRGDPQEELRVGRDHYCSSLTGLGGGNVSRPANYPLEELYVVDAGRSGTAVLIRRQDVNAPAGNGFLSGYTVPIATWLRVLDGKIVEWFDAPPNKISAAALPFKIPVQGPNSRVRPSCVQYADGSSAGSTAGSSNATLPAKSLDYVYGTDKPEFFFNPFEKSAAQAVRAFNAAWRPDNALALGAFVDANVSFRADPTATQLGHGRDNLLKQLCGSMIGTRKLRDLFVVGADYETSVLTRWDQTEARGNVTRGASFFRVQNGLVVEWLDLPESGVAPAAANTAACGEVNTALAAG